MMEEHRRFIIVNADDFGLSEGINRGIIEAHEHGVVTSASLMVRYPAAISAGDLARAHPRLSIGLHFEAGEWRCANGEWKLAYRVVETDDATEIEKGLDRQLADFERLVGRLPTHLDSHQHVHQSEPCRAVLQARAKKLQVPLRGVCSAIEYCGSFYGQTDEGEDFPAGITAEAFASAVALARPEWTEIGCHPGYANELDSVYARAREDELRVLQSPEVRNALKRNRATLRSFANFLDEAR